MPHSSTHPQQQPRWQRIPRSPATGRARSSSEQRDHRISSEHQALLHKTFHINTSVTGYKADMGLAHDYYPFGMLMPGRYISDTGKHCITLNTTILVPKVTRIPKYDIVPDDGIRPHQWGGTGTVQVAKLPKANSFAAEKLHVYHYNPASQHPGGWVTDAYEEEGQMHYRINLGGEPSGVSAYMHIHADTSQAQQEVGFSIALDGSYNVEARVRQYYDSVNNEYEDAVAWTQLQSSGQQQLLVPINKQAVEAGGPTMLELRFLTLNGGNFTDQEAALWEPYIYVTTWVPESRIATICDEQDNYRYGFNGMEKDNEPKGIGNSLDFGARIYDSRLGRFLSLDPLARKFPSESNYSFAGNSPIYLIDKKGEKKVVYTTILTDKAPPKVVTYTQLNEWKIVNGYDGTITAADYHINQTIDLRSGTPKSQRFSQSSKIPDDDVSVREMFVENMESIFGELKPPFQVMVFGSGKDYQDWLKNPRAQKGVRTYSIDFKELSETFDLILTGMISEPNFNAPTGPESFETSMEKMVDIVNNEVQDKMNENAEGTGFCRDCKGNYKDGKPTKENTGKNGDTISAGQHKH